MFLRQQAVLAKFGELALRSENVDEILTEACRLVGEALETDLAKVMYLRIPRKMGIDSTASWAVIPRLGQSGRLVHGVRPDPTGQAVSW